MPSAAGVGHRVEPWRRRAVAVVPVVVWFVATGRPVAAQDTAVAMGRIEGVAVLAPRLTSQHRRVRIYSEPGGREARDPPAESPLENLVVYLETAPPGPVPRGGAPPVMRQHDETFVPHVLPVLAGTNVAFPNDDPVFHNVFSLSRAKSFDLGRFPRGESKSVSFPKTGVVQVFCHIHADMSAYILVLDNSFFTKPDSTGRFVLDAVPPGEYRLVAWHERIRPISRPIRVVAGQSTDIRLSIPLTESADST